MHAVHIKQFYPAREERLFFHCHGEEYMMPFAQLDCRKSVLLYLPGSKDRKMRLSLAVDICHHFVHTRHCEIKRPETLQLLLAFIFTNKLNVQIIHNECGSSVVLNSV